MKTLFLFTLICATSICWSSTYAQDFLKTYNDPASPNSSVSFECITEQTDSSGNFFIGGHIGDTIALFKMNTSGTVLATYKIKPSPANTKLDAIMLVFDAATNSQKIVVLGNKQTSGGNEGFMFRFDKTNPAVDWFRQTASSSAIAYWDMADKAGSYYIVSGERRTDGSAVILKVIKATGAPSVALNYAVAGLEDPQGIQLSGSTLYATGRYTLPGGTSSGDGFRPCFTRINTATTPSFTHLGTNYYIKQKAPQAIAKMYSTDILVRGNTTVMVGYGDDNNTTDPYKNLNITKVNTTTGILTWSKKYDNPSTASDGTLTEIRSDNTNNYIVMGFGINANTGAMDRAKLWRVDATNGNLLWNRQYNLYRRTTNNGNAYGYGFAISGNYIYAVGQDRTSGITKGVLLKVNTADGNVSGINGTSCYDTLNIKKSTYNFSDSVPVNILAARISSPNSIKEVFKTPIKDSL